MASTDKMDSCRDRKKGVPKAEVAQKHNQDSSPFEIPQVSSPQQTIASPDLAFIFNPQRDNIKPYHLDGDTSMYTEVAIAQRNALRTDPTVVDAINDFMTLYSTDQEGGIDRKEYERMFHKLCSVFRANLDAVEKKTLADEDWKRDSKGQGKMTRLMLFDSLFELCDIWCPNIDSREYKAFFEHLKFRIKYEGQQNVGAYDILK